MKVDAKIFADGREASFVYPNADPSSITLLVETLAALGALVRPIAIDLILKAYDAESQEERPLESPFWYLVDAREPAIPEPGRACVVVDFGAPASIAQTFASAFELNRPPEGTVLVWEQLTVWPTLARLPGALCERDALLLRDHANEHTGMVEDHAWLRASPGAPPPFSILLANQFSVRMTITRYWSLWEAGEPGQGDYNAAIAQVQRIGWRPSS